MTIGTLGWVRGRLVRMRHHDNAAGRRSSNPRGERGPLRGLGRIPRGARRPHREERVSPELLEVRRPAADWAS
jgi:hypothetical protein